MFVGLDGLYILRRFYRKPESRKIHLRVYVKMTIFWDITPCNPLKAISRKIELFITTDMTTSNPIHLHVVQVDLYWTDAN
jgi:hypothetical protein